MAKLSLNVDLNILFNEVLKSKASQKLQKLSSKQVIVTSLTLMPMCICMHPQKLQVYEIIDPTVQYLLFCRFGIRKTVPIY